VFVLLLHLAEAFEDLVHLVKAGGVFERLLQGFEFVVKYADAARPGDGFIEHGPALHLFDVLPEVADGELLRHGDIAFVGSLFADDHAEQGGLAGAVGSDQTDLFAGVQLEVGVDKNELLAVLLIEVGKRNHPNLQGSRLSG